MLHGSMNDAEALKKIAGEAACEFVKTGMGWIRNWFDSEIHRA